MKRLLFKERATLKMRQLYFKECFEIMILDESSRDVSFAKKVAQLGCEWHDNNTLIWYQLFKTLITTKEPAMRQQAIQILSKNCDKVPY